MLICRCLMHHKAGYEPLVLMVFSNFAAKVRKKIDICKRFMK